MGDQNGEVIFDFLGGAISRKRNEIKLSLQLITDLKSLQKSITLDYRNGKNAHEIIGSQKVICYVRNVRLVLVLLFIVFCIGRAV